MSLKRHLPKALAIARRLRAHFRQKRSLRLPLDGLVFIVVTFAIGVAAMNTAAQLLFLVFSMMCAFWMLSAIAATVSLRRNAIMRVAPHTVVAGQPATVRLSLENRKRLFASYSLRVVDIAEGDVPVGAGFFARVPPRARETASYDVVFPRRGAARFGGFSLSTRFPFGLIEREVRWPSAHEVVVLPPLVDVTEIVRYRGIDFGDDELHAKGQGAGLYGLRPYIAGDSARDIHWRVSARMDSLMVREYESEERRRATILLDNRAPSDLPTDVEDDLECAIILAGSLVADLVERGHQVELLTASGKVAFGQGRPHILRCRRALALLRREPAEALPPHSHVETADSVQVDILWREHQKPAPDSHGIRVAEHRAGLRGALSRTVPQPPPDPASVFEVFEP